MTDPPFALFLTWTTYGTWMPGDERGYVADTLNADGTTEAKHNQVGTPYLKDNAFAHVQARKRQKGPTAWLSPANAKIAAESLIDAAIKRHWKIVRGAIMANHVHLLSVDVPDDGPAVRRIFKGVSQKELTQRANDGTSRRWWTRGGSDRYLHDDRSVEGAMRYIEGQRGALVRIVDNAIVNE